jgi:hypothetical protein
VDVSNGLMQLVAYDKFPLIFQCHAHMSEVFEIPILLLIVLFQSWSNSLLTL